MEHLVDRYARKLSYLRISVTDRCNLRCRYCMPDEGIDRRQHSEIIRYEEIFRLLDIIVPMGIRKVRITGGEPLIRKGIVEFIEKASGIDGLEHLCLTTNGVLLDDMASDLENAGIGGVNISLDTLDRSKFSYMARRDSFEMVRRGIMSVLDTSISPVKLNVVAIEGFNDDEIPAFARLSMELPVDVRFIELMPIGCAARYSPGRLVRSERIKEVIEKDFGTMETEPAEEGPARIFHIKGACGRIGFISPLTEKTFCSRCNRLRLTSEGKLKPCLFSDTEVDLLGALRDNTPEKEIVRLIDSAVDAKPASGRLDRSGKGPKHSMNEIGG